MYIQARVIEHYCIIGGVVLCFTPLFFYSFTPFLVFFVCSLIALFSFAISPNYFRFKSIFESVALIVILSFGSLLAVIDLSEFLRFNIDSFLYFLSIEIVIRTMLYEFMIRKGFRNTIPLIFVQVLYLVCSLAFLLNIFEMTVVPILLLGISIGISTVILLTKRSLWWQLALATISTYCLLSFKVQ